MKVAGRIVLGFTILLASLAGLFVCQILALHQMQSANRRNSGENLRAAMAALQVMRDRDAVEESARQYFSNPDAESQAQLKSSQETFESGLNGLKSSVASEREQGEATRLSQFWREFSESLARLQPASQTQESAAKVVTQAQIPQDLVEQLEGLRSQAYSLYQASTQTLSSEAETARKTGDRAELVLWILVAMALVVGLFVSVSVLRSIATPLRHLAEGTRAIAEGKEFYRLDTSRNDEFSQIAKDFNTLARRLRSGDAEQNGHQ